METTRDRSSNTDSTSSDTVTSNVSAAATTDQRRFRVDFASALTLLGRGLGRAAPAPAPAPETLLPPVASNASNDLPPPLASDSDESDSDSDASDDSDSDGQSDVNSMPSLQTVSDSSDDEDAAMYDTESEGSGWDEHDVRDDLRRDIETISDSAERPAHHHYGPPYSDDEEEEEEEEWEDEDDEFLDDELADQGTEIPLNSIDLLEWLMSPRRLAVDNDPQRAETLLAGLEAVSDELVRRYEKLRGGDGEAAEGCAICRDDYLIEHSRDPSEFHKLTGADLTSALFEFLPFHPSPHQILVFPCPGRHLFHRSCLSPWLARKTTCPSCRFDIDPDSLTLRLTGTISSYAAGVRKWEPPKLLGLEGWLAEEERYRMDGHRAVCPHTARPDVTAQPRSGMRVTFADDDEFAHGLDEDLFQENTFHLARQVPNHSSGSQLRSAVVASRRRSPSSRRLAFSRGSHAPPRGPSRNVHEAAVEELFTRILRLEQTIGRANTSLHSHPHSPSHSPPPSSPELLPDVEGAGDDEWPAFVE